MELTHKSSVWISILYCVLGISLSLSQQKRVVRLQCHNCQWVLKIFRTSTMRYRNVCLTAFYMYTMPESIRWRRILAIGISFLVVCVCFRTWLLFEQSRANVDLAPNWSARLHFRKLFRHLCGEGNDASEFDVLQAEGECIYSIVWLSTK